MREAAQTIHHTIMTRNHARAVFFIDGKVKDLPADGKRVDMMTQDFPASLVGIYNGHCSPGWIEEDLEHVRDAAIARLKG